MPIDEATFAARFGIPTNSELEGVNGPGALALRYLSQGLPGFRGSLSEWSFQRPFDHDKPDKVLCRLWWPRFAAQIELRVPRATARRLHLRSVEFGGDAAHEKPSDSHPASRRHQGHVRIVSSSPRKRSTPPRALAAASFAAIVYVAALSSDAMR